MKLFNKLVWKVRRFIGTAPRITLILAADSNGCIGKEDGSLPWGWIKEDMKFFSQTTKGHAVIMGRKTWDTLPRGLPNRFSIVITRSLRNFVYRKVLGSLRAVDNIWAALRWATTYSVKKEIFVIGGAEIANLFLQEGLVERVLLTRIVMDSEFYGPRMARISLAGYKYVERGEYVSVTNDRGEKGFISFETWTL